MYLQAILSDRPLAYWPVMLGPVSAPLAISSYGESSAALNAVQTGKGSVTSGLMRSGGDGYAVVTNEYADGALSGGSFLRADLGAAVDNSGFTAELWYANNFDRTSSTERTLIGSPDGAWFLNLMRINQPSSTSILRPLLGTTGGKTGWTTANDVRSLAFSEVFQWHHVALSWNGSVLKVYLNGALLSSATVTGSAKPFRYVDIGAYFSSPTATSGTFAALSVAHPAIFRGELSAARIQAHYQAGRAAVRTGISGVQNQAALLRPAGRGYARPPASLRPGHPVSQPAVPAPGIRVLNGDYELELRSGQLKAVQGLVPVTLGSFGQRSPFTSRRPAAEARLGVLAPTSITPSALANLKSGYEAGYRDALRSTIRRHTPIFITNRRI